MIVLLRNIGLFILSIIGVIIFGIGGFLYGLIRNPKGTSDKFFEMSRSNDRFCGVSAAELFNNTLITKDSTHKFGDGRQTVSGYLGQNQVAGTLSRIGKWVVNKLNKIDHNHAVDAIGWRKKK